MLQSIPALAAGILFGALPFSASSQMVSDTAPPIAPFQIVSALAAVRTPNGRRNRADRVSRISPPWLLIHMFDFTIQIIATTGVCHRLCVRPCMQVRERRQKRLAGIVIAWQSLY